MNRILAAFSKKNFQLKNHLVMSPMTRSRAVNNIPNDLMAEYYGQRTGAGLIITEGTAPSADALGYPSIPGIFSEAQIEGWKKTTSTVHKEGTKIFLQMMHTGRIGHVDNLPDGATILGASDIKAAGQIFTITNGLQNHSDPVALTIEGIKDVVAEFATAAKNAVAAGFDGVEIHGANGYIVEQFLNPNVNNRIDEYGGSVLNRSKFTLEVLEAVVNAIGKDKVGIRISPFSTASDMQPYNEDEVNETYIHLATELNKMDIAYLHVGANPDIPQKTFDDLRMSFDNTIILSNGLTPESGEQALQKGFADLVGYGTLFLANPDFDKRLEKGSVFNVIDPSTFYSPGAKGYTDYPFLK